VQGLQAKAMLVALDMEQGKIIQAAEAVEPEQLVLLV
jgi:hypothetical protein